MPTETIAGKYKIVREIARSNDVVYEAIDTAMDRRVAVKELVIPPNLTGQPLRDRVSRFSREARAAGRLTHPNIVTVFDFGQDEGRYFIAMEYLEGITLRDRMLTGGTMPISEAIDIASQVLDGLAHAHRYKVIHRDVKPDNIHILPGGLVKLTDFGIARLTEEASLTADGQVFGTPSYMSPEQIGGREIDHRTDLFSLGVVLYEMLTGRKPFVGDNVVSITYNIMYSEPPAMSSVPVAIEEVVFKALSKAPQQRPNSADDMRAALRAAEAQPPVYGSSNAMGGGLNAPATIMQGGAYPQQPSWPGNIFGTPTPASGSAGSTSASQAPPAPQTIAGPFATWGSAAAPAGTAPPPVAPPAPPAPPPQWLIDLEMRVRTFFAVIAWVIAISAVVVGFVYLFTAAFNLQRSRAPVTTPAGTQSNSTGTPNGGDASSDNKPIVLSGDLAAAQAKLDQGDRLWANDQPSEAVDAWLAACSAPYGSTIRESAMNRLGNAAEQCYHAAEDAYSKGDSAAARSLWDASRKAMPGTAWAQKSQARWDETAPKASQ